MGDFLDITDEKVIKLSNYNELPANTPSFHTQTFPYSESQAEREQVLNGIKTRIEDIKKVSVTKLVRSQSTHTYISLISVLPHFPGILHFLHGTQLIPPLCLHSPSLFSSSPFLLLCR